MFGRKAVPMHPEDARLLEIARELCGQMGFFTNPRTINWRGKMGIRSLPPDFIVIYRGGLLSGTIMLSQKAMGKLTPEEWRPLLASGLAYSKNLNTGMLKAMLPMFAVAFLEPVILVGSFRFLGDPQLALLRYLFLGLTFVLLGLSFVFVLRRMKSLHFKADQRAADLVGKGSLINSLMKIGSIDQMSATKRTGLVRPSVTERINHLTNYSTPGQ